MLWQLHDSYHCHQGHLPSALTTELSLHPGVICVKYVLYANNIAMYVIYSMFDMHAIHDIHVLHIVHLKHTITSISDLGTDNEIEIYIWCTLL